MSLKYPGTAEQLETNFNDQSNVERHLKVGRRLKRI